MWSRAELKSRAKDVLRNSYWYSFVVVLILGVISSIFSINFSAYEENRGGNSDSIWSAFDGLFYSKADILMVLAVIAFVFLVFVLTLSYRVFIVNAMLVGSKKFFMNASYGNTSMDSIIYVFKSRYVNIIKTMFITDILISLWSLLFVIPGIIKMYQYKFVPYILAENPDIGYKEALEISTNMTSGEKWNIFVLDLSFLGWYILGTIACGIGILFVQPYYFATETQLYFEMKYNIDRI